MIVLFSVGLFFTTQQPVKKTVIVVNNTTHNNTTGVNTTVEKISNDNNNSQQQQTNNQNKEWTDANGYHHYIDSNGNEMVGTPDRQHMSVYEHEVVSKYGMGEESEKILSKK